MDLILGAEGFLGRAIATAFGKSFRPFLALSRHSPGREFFDLSKPEEFLARLAEQPFQLDRVYFTAACTSLAKCRENPEQSKKLNVENTALISRKLLEAGARVVLFSSNLVFNGAQPETPAETEFSPQTEYGRQKAELEELFRGVERVSILRLTKVLGTEVELIKKWKSALLQGQKIKAFTDYTLSPISLDYVLAALKLITERQLDGVFQLSAKEELSYYELAQLLASKLQVSTDLVEAALAKVELPELEHLPQHSSLATDRAQRELNLRPLSVEALLDSLV